MNAYIGIDPGKKGAMAIIAECGSLENVLVKVIPYDMVKYVDTLRKLDLELRLFPHKQVCCVERVSAMPGQGVKSMFSFGMNFGWIQGVLMALEFSFETVPPQKWKKEFSLGSDKKASIETAHKLFPQVSLRPTERCKVDNDGMAEALLMAEYARRNM